VPAPSVLATPVTFRAATVAAVGFGFAVAAADVALVVEVGVLVGLVPLEASQLDAARSGMGHIARPALGFCLDRSAATGV
jgi:hypothetical protein